MSRNNSQTDRQQLPAPPAWGSPVTTDGQQPIDRRATLINRLMKIYQALCEPEFVNAATEVDGASERVEYLKGKIQSIGEELDRVPTIKVALLGPSRHGKSTLLNALAACSILPMSDIRPCTASIVSLKRASEWGFEIRFVTERRLKHELQQAVTDARNYLARVSQKAMGGEEPDDPQYLNSTLQRFIQLFGIDANLGPNELVERVASASLPQDLQRLLGQTARPRSASVDQMRNTVERFLSTKDIYWTIVDTCVISGPFQDWHPNLELIDVPGTNDTDAQRTEITNSLRRTAKAVAICTSDSNLGNDIQSWLRNSSVLGDFLEATEKSRQHLFILRTKFDAFHPEIDESKIDPDDDASEDHLYREAIDRHKEQQTASYREMFRNISAPLLPFDSSPAEQKKREEMLARIDGIRVYFVSALAHESFAGRWKGTSRQKRHFSEQFNDDPEATGIPQLKRFTNEMAESYLSEFYYDDLERLLETEVDRLVRFFRQQWATLDAELGGGSQAIADLVAEIDNVILPWLDDAAERGAQRFQQAAHESSAMITKALNKTAQELAGKLEAKLVLWRTFYWNSLQAAARRKGIHTTCHGQFIDINQDICSMFVDDLSLSWATYRDTFIRSSTDIIANEIAANLQTRLDEAAARADMPEATAAIDAIVTNLASISRSQREEFRRRVDAAIQQMESIRRPAYEAVQEMMHPIYVALSGEYGSGCQERMRNLLCRGASENVHKMWTRVSNIVRDAVLGLEQQTAESLRQYGQLAVRGLQKSTGHLKKIGKVARHDQLLHQMGQLQTAALLLWDTLGSLNSLLVVAPQPAMQRLPAPKATEAPTDHDAPANDDATAGGETAEANVVSVPPEPIRVAVEPSKYARLCECPVYLVQKERAGRAAPDDHVILQILETLDTHHRRMSIVTLADKVGVPAFRMRGVLAGVQRILNLDGQQILQITRNSDSVELHEQLMRQEFAL